MILNDFFQDFFENIPRIFPQKQSSKWATVAPNNMTTP
jgi:hypothetical protein